MARHNLSRELLHLILLGALGGVLVALLVNLPLLLELGKPADNLWLLELTPRSGMDSEGNPL